MPLTGSGILDAKGGTVVNMVPDACTVTTAAGTYQVAGKCAHGSTPWRGENAIDRAMEQLPAESGRSPRHIGRCLAATCMVKSWALP